MTMNSEPLKVANEICGIEEAQAKTFVGENADYYWSKWNAAQNPLKRAGWNWSAFLAGFFWLGYRKMYVEVWMFAALFLAFDIAEFLLQIPFSKSLGIIVSSVLGMGGNTLYLKHMQKKIALLTAQNLTAQETDVALAETGGASWRGVGISVLIFALYLSLSFVVEVIVKAARITQASS